MDVQLPVDKTAETIVLGRMLASVNAATDSLERLCVQDFFHPEYQAIFSSMRTLYESGQHINPDTVMSVLIKDYPKYADPSLVYGLEVHSSVHEDVQHFVDLVLECSHLRRFVALGKELITLSVAKKPSAQIADLAWSAVDQITSGAEQTKIISIGEAFLKKNEHGRDFLEEVQHKQDLRRRGLSTLTGYSTGYPILDETLDGLNKGHFIVIGARPGTGKSTFIMNLISNLVQQKVAVGFFSLEMSVEDVTLKYACMKAGLEYEKIRRGPLTNLEFQTLFALMNTSKQDSFYVDESGTLTTAQVESRIKSMIKNFGVKVLFVDYFGEVKGLGKFGNKQEEMQLVSRSLRNIAKKFNIPVVCIAQLNRETEKNNRVPIKSDLRESGQLEADAHSIIMLHRPDQEEIANQPGILNLHIIKNRFGAQKIISYSFNGSTSRYAEMPDLKEAVKKVNSGEAYWK